jgi:FMN reductase
MTMLDLDLDLFRVPPAGWADQPSARRGGRRPRVVAIGGSTRPGSSAELAVRVAAAAAEDAGAEVTVIAGRDLMLPIYDTECRDRTPAARRLVEAVRAADGVLLSSPGYHGALSGLVKNAVDYLEDLRDDERPYLDGRAVGCVAVAYGCQASVTTLQQLRQVTHALRGWPTPQGCAVNASLGPVTGPSQESVHAQLRVAGRQVVEFAVLQARLSPVI